MVVTGALPHAVGPGPCPQARPAPNPTAGEAVDARADNVPGY